MTEPLLHVAGLDGWYGESKVLHAMAFDVPAGELVTLVGRNGAGKSTTLKAVMGLLRRKSGVIRLAGSDIATMPPERIARLGIAYCPEERGIFSSLTVAENLTLPPVVAAGGMTIADINALFPNLAERHASPGTKLSGGEQQMLAIARILRTGARLLLLDEPTEGLAPVIVRQIGQAIARLKAAGFTVVLVEQNIRFAARLADRAYVIEHGRVIDALSAADLAAGTGRLESYLRV